MTRHLITGLIPIPALLFAHLVGDHGLMIFGAVVLGICAYALAYICWTCQLWKDNQK